MRLSASLPVPVPGAGWLAGCCTVVEASASESPNVFRCCACARAGTIFFAKLPVFAILQEIVEEQPEGVLSAASTPAPSPAFEGIANDTSLKQGGSKAAMSSLSSPPPSSSSSSAAATNNLESRPLNQASPTDKESAPSVSRLGQPPTRSGSGHAPAPLVFGEAAGAVDVLYVDDSTVNLKMIGRMLRGENISFHCSQNGEQLYLLCLVLPLACLLARLLLLLLPFKRPAVRVFISAVDLEVCGLTD